MDKDIQALKRNLRRAGLGSVVHISNEAKVVLDEVVEFVHSSMCHYSYNSGGSNYSCLFCGREPLLANFDITHEKDCKGERIIVNLRNIIEQLEEG